MILINRADGVKGHYCIGRPRHDFFLGYRTTTWEFYNNGQWVSAGEVFDTKAKAISKMKELKK